MTNKINEMPSEILDFIVYSEDSPTFLRWKNALYYPSLKDETVLLCKRKAGSVAGGRNTQGYYCVPILGKYYLVHRLIYSLHHGNISESFIDHIDGDVTNNHIANLRAVNRSGNSRNKAKVPRKVPEIPTGIHWETSEKVWVARYVSPTEIGKNGKKKRKKLRFSPNDFLNHPDPVAAALSAAVIWRTEKIKETNKILIEQGEVSYSERHGKQLKQTKRKEQNDTNN